MRFTPNCVRVLHGVALLAVAATASPNTCIVPTGLSDSGPAIARAFEECGHNSATSRGKVLFENATYIIGSVLNTTHLSNVDIDIQGTLAWNNSDIPYWLQNSLPTGYQEQYSAWLFGGERIHWTGNGHGTLDGKGQAWYDFVKGQSNYPRRPHQITIMDTTDSTFEGLRFLNSQMWTMTITRSSNITLRDIYVNSTSTSGTSTSNTDGADTMFSDNIHFERWTVVNGDDCIALKANSTNISITDSVCYRGQGIAFGSIGQYNNTFETIENVLIRNLTTHNTRYGAFIKTWTGVSQGVPPNGGGGGIGYMNNITLAEFSLNNTANVFLVTQCTNYEGNRGQCDTSKFNIHNVRLKDWKGTTKSGAMVSLDCSKASACYDFALEGMDIRVPSNGTVPAAYCCDAVKNGTTAGFQCNAPIWRTNNGA